MAARLGLELPGPVWPLRGIAFGSSTHGWAIGRARVAAGNPDVVWRSTDGGATWVQQAALAVSATGSRPRMPSGRGSARGPQSCGPPTAARRGSRWPGPAPPAPCSRPMRWGGASTAGASSRRRTAALRGRRSSRSRRLTPPGTGITSPAGAPRRGYPADDRWRRDLEGRGHRLAGGRCVPVRGCPQRLGLAQRVAGAGSHHRWRRDVATTATGTTMQSGLQFVDSLTGWVRDDVQDRRTTTDGGASWQQVAAANEIGYGLQFVDRNMGGHSGEAPELHSAAWSNVDIGKDAPRTAE